MILKFMRFGLLLATSNGSSDIECLDEICIDYIHGMAQDEYIKVRVHSSVFS